MTEKINSGDYLGEEQDLESVPMRGDDNPQVGNGFTQWLATAVLSIFGWKLVGRIPNLRKMLAIGAPHTSNWDWILVILSAYSLGLKISWLGKNSAFNSPLGPMFRYFGGVPVDRSAPHGLVGESVNNLKRADELLLCITPEGTRSKVQNWKSGFYHIAHQAGVLGSLCTLCLSVCPCDRACIPHVLWPCCI